MDDPLPRHFLVAVDTGLRCCTGISCKAEEHAGKENNSVHEPYNHATL
jgi:hypothetical protein